MALLDIFEKHNLLGEDMISQSLFKDCNTKPRPVRYQLHILDPDGTVVEETVYTAKRRDRAQTLAGQVRAQMKRVNDYAYKNGTTVKIYDLKESCYIVG